MLRLLILGFAFRDAFSLRVHCFYWLLFSSIQVCPYSLDGKVRARGNTHLYSSSLDYHYPLLTLLRLIERSILSMSPFICPYKTEDRKYPFLQPTSKTTSTQSPSFTKVDRFHKLLPLIQTYLYFSQHEDHRDHRNRHPYGHRLRCCRP